MAASDSARPRKRSVTLRGHRTSVSLEEPFWQAFRQIAADRALSVNELAARIDAERATDIGLASAIRVFVLRELTQTAPGPDQPSAREGDQSEAW